MVANHRKSLKISGRLADLDCTCTINSELCIKAANHENFNQKVQNKIFISVEMDSTFH